MARRGVPLLLANRPERARLLGACANQPLTDACIASVVDRWGTRVWRRPLEAAESADLLQFYRTMGGGEAGLGFLLRRMLQAPTLVFHFEDRGADEGQRLRLTPHEVAARLSYLTVSSLADEALLAAAAADELKTKAQRSAHVRRLLETPRGRQQVRDFFRYYLHLTEVPAPYAPLLAKRGLAGEGLRTELYDEALSFSERVFWSAKSSFRELMTSTESEPKTARVATMLGASCGAPDTSDTFGWNDASAFWHADGTMHAAPVQTLSQPGWFVWQVPAGRIGAAQTRLRIELTAAAAAAVQLNVNDQVQLQTVMLTAGPGAVELPLTVTAGQALKVGLRLKSGGALTLQQLQLSSGDAPVQRDCGVVQTPKHPGVLHRPALLVTSAERTAPILRGAHVRKGFLCAPMPMPDTALVQEREEQVGDVDAMPNRERAAVLTSPAQCNGCHAFINPLGFSFEGYDQLAMPRQSEEVLNADGTVKATWAINTQVEDPRLDEVGGPTRLTDSLALANAMAESGAARACFAQMAFEHTWRQPIDLERDGCALAASEALVAGGSLQDVLVELFVADDILFRSAP